VVDDRDNYKIQREKKGEMVCTLVIIKAMALLEILTWENFDMGNYLTTNSRVREYLGGR
jgi:hypothetical protein